MSEFGNGTAGGVIERLGQLAQGQSQMTAAIRALTATQTIAGLGVANVQDFGAVGDNSTDDSGAIQLAINSGLPVYFPAGHYRAANLTQNTPAQSLFTLGGATITKNANGPILTCTASGVQCLNLGFHGESATPLFTGNNVEFTSDNCALLNCGSRWAYGRAVKATGGHFQISGTCDIYQTAATGATSYDIEIGVSGTATLYHQILGVYSSQGSGTGNGGILLTDTGSAVVLGGQFGKLTIAAGTSPAGVNGGNILGCRILGNVSIGISNAEFVANAFAVVAITIETGVTGVHLDASNSFQSGATVTNNGAGNNFLERSVGTSGTIQLQYGDDSSIAILDISPSASAPDFTFPSWVVVPNDRGHRILGSAGTNAAQWYVNTSNDVFFQNVVTDRTIAHSTVGTGTGSRHQFYVDGASKLVVNTTGVISADAVMMHTSTSLTNVAASAIATMTNAPTAGNPTKWVPIDDNGTTRYVPAW